jgi:hypothetical protein
MVGYLIHHHTHHIHVAPGDIYKSQQIFTRPLSGRKTRSTLLKLQVSIIFAPSTPIQHLVLLAVHGLNILASKNGVVVDLVLLDTHVRLGVGIELGSLVCEVEVDGVRPRESD